MQAYSLYTSEEKVSAGLKPSADAEIHVLKSRVMVGFFFPLPSPPTRRLMVVRRRVRVGGWLGG